jgi:hypothetical protein
MSIDFSFHLDGSIELQFRHGSIVPTAKERSKKSAGKPHLLFKSGRQAA